MLNTQLTMHEHSFNNQHPANVPSDLNAQTRRTDNLWTCLTTIKAVFETFFSLDTFPLVSYPDISLAFFTCLAHSMAALFRLSTFQSSDVSWDRHRVTQELDLREVLKLWSLRWSLVPATAELEGTEMGGEASDVWTCTKDKLSALSTWFELKLAAMSAADDERQNGQGSEENETMNSSVPVQHQMDLEFTAVNFDMFDDAWTRDIFGGFDILGETHI
jgi:hypothetical protein